MRINYKLCTIYYRIIIPNKKDFLKITFLKIDTVLGSGTYLVSPFDYLGKYYFLFCSISFILARNPATAEVRRKPFGSGGSWNTLYPAIPALDQVRFESCPETRLAIEDLVNRLADELGGLDEMHGVDERAVTAGGETRRAENVG